MDLILPDKRIINNDGTISKMGSWGRNLILISEGSLSEMPY